MDLVVCSSCARGEGAQLAQRLLDAGCPVSHSECLGACSRGCVVALQAHAKKTWVFGDLNAMHAAALIDVCRHYMRSPDGTLPPDVRLPPLRRPVARLPVLTR
jgi:predicted metal-binding protein